MSRKLFVTLLFVVMMSGFGAVALAEDVILMSNDSYYTTTTSGLTIPSEYSQYAKYENNVYTTYALPEGEPNVVSGTTSNGKFSLEKSKVTCMSSEISPDNPLTVVKNLPANYNLINRIARISGYFNLNVEGDLTGLTASDFYLTDDSGYAPRVYSIDPANQMITVVGYKFILSTHFTPEETIFSIKTYAGGRTFKVKSILSKYSFTTTDNHSLWITPISGHGWTTKHVVDGMMSNFIGLAFACPKEEEMSSNFNFDYYLWPDNSTPADMAGKYLAVKVTMDFNLALGSVAFMQTDGGWDLDPTYFPDDVVNGKTRRTALYTWDGAAKGKPAPSLVTQAMVTLQNNTTKTKDFAPEGKFFSPTADPNKENFLGFGSLASYPDSPIEMLEIEANPTKKKDGINGTVEMTKGELIIPAIADTLGNGDNALIHGMTYRHTELGGLFGQGWLSRLDASLNILSNGLPEEQEQTIRRLAIYRDGMANDELFSEMSPNSKIFEGYSSDKVIDLNLNPVAIYDFATCATTTFSVKNSSTTIQKSYYLIGEKTSNVETAISWEGDGVRPLTMTMKEATADMPYSFQFVYTATTDDGKTPIRVYQKKGTDTLGKWVDFIKEGSVLSEVRYCYPKTGNTAIYPTVKLAYDGNNLLQSGFSALFRSEENNNSLYDLKQRFSVGYQPRTDLNRTVVCSEATYIRKETSPGVFEDMPETTYTFEYDWSDPKNKISKAILSGMVNQYTFGYIDGEVNFNSYNIGSPTTIVSALEEDRDFRGRVTSSRGTARDGQAVVYSAAQAGHSNQVQSVSMMDKDGNTAYPTNFSYVDSANGYFKKTDTSASGAITTYFYDFEEASQGDLNGDGITNQSYGNIVKVERGTGTPLATTTLTRYYPNGKVKETVDAEGMITRNVYYLQGEQGYPNLKQVIVDADRLNLTTEYTYDDWGRVLTVMDPKGNITTNEYNGQGQLVRTIGPAPFNYQTLYTYLPDGRQDEIWVENKDKDGNLNPAQPWLKTRYVYDATGRTKWSEREKTPGVWVASSGETTYLTDGRIDITRDIFGVQTKYEYDSFNRNFKTTRAFGNTVATSTQTVYDPATGRVVSSIDGRGNTPSTTEYDTFGRAYRTVNAFGTISETVYDTFGRTWKQQTWDSTHTILLAETVNVYDALDRVCQTQALWNEAPGGPAYIVTSRQEFDLNGRVVRSWDANNNLTTTVYDTAGRAYKTIDSAGNETESVFDANGNAIQSIRRDKNPDGTFVVFTTTTEYDELNRVKWTQDNAGNKSYNYYDSRSNLVYTIDREGNTTTNEFNALGQLMRTVKDIRNSGGAIIDTIEKRMEYFDDGKLWKEIDDNNNITTYSYDELGRKSQTLYADGTTINTTYDLNSNALTVTDQNQTAVTNTYDILNRLTQRNINRGSGVIGTTLQTFGFDAQGRMTSATDNNDPNDATDDSSCTMTYDSLGRLLTERQTIGTKTHTVTNAYGNMNRTSLTYPGGRVINYAHDALNRITAMNEGGTPTIAYSYVGNRLFDKNYRNGATTTPTYDTLGRMSGLQHATTSTTIVSFEHVFDKEGNKRYERRQWQNYDKGDFYSYDSIYRLTSTMYKVPGSELEAYKNNGTVPTTSEKMTTFNMDGVGNRTTVVDSQSGTINYVTNNMNEYAVVNGTTKTNDDAGNLLDDGTKLFTWDFSNRLVEVYEKATSTLIVSYKYDARGRRVARISGTGGGQGAMQVATSKATTADAKNPQARAAKINALQAKIRGLENALAQHLKNKPNSNTTPPVAKGKGKLEEVIDVQQAYASTNAINNLTQELNQTYTELANELNLTGNCYWFYDGDEIVEQRDDADVLMSSWVNGISIDERIEIDLSGIKYYYHLNTLGTVYALTDSTGVVVERYEYDSYGKATIYDPTLTIQRTYSIAGNFSLFTGRQLDYETGLYYFRARMYDPETGRLLSRDPLDYQDGMGLYEYVRGNPVNGRDPYGQERYYVPEWTDGPLDSDRLDITPHGSHFVVQNSLWWYSGVNTENWSNIEKAAKDWKTAGLIFDNWATKESILTQLEVTGADDVLLIVGHGLLATKESAVPTLTMGIRGKELTSEEIISAIKKDNDHPAMIIFAGCVTLKVAQDVLEKTNVKVTLGIDKYKYIPFFMDTMDGWVGGLQYRFIKETMNFGETIGQAVQITNKTVKCDSLWRLYSKQLTPPTEINRREGKVKIADTKDFTVEELLRQK